MTQFVPEALFEQGFSELVSVIPPGAQLLPSSKINPSLIGKIPGRRTANGLWAGYDWRKFTPSKEVVHQWCLDGANFGLRADRFPAVDIDCTDERLVKIIMDAAFAKLGTAPVRTGRAPKQLLMYQTVEPFGRMRLWIERNGEKHLVEILGQGQQYLVHGTHPATMQPYRWNIDLGDLDYGMERGPNLTTITREQASSFLEYLAEMLEMLGVGSIKRQGDGRVVEHNPGDQASLVAPSMDVLRDAVRVIPNTDSLFPARDDYIKIGYAIKAAAGDDEDEGYNIFSEWAEKWDGGTNDPEVVRQDWRRMHGPYAIGWNFLAEQARGFGFSDADLDFDAVAEEETPDTQVLLAPYSSDQWLADKVVVRQRGKLRYIPEKGCWLAWDNGQWKIDAELLAEDVIKKELRVIADEVMRVGATEKEKKESLKIAQQICSAGKVTAIGSLVKSDRAIAVSMEHLDQNPMALNTPAGIVDLFTGAMRVADPDELMSKITTVPPDAASGCPEWNRFLLEATDGDEELVAYLKRLCGYALTGVVSEQQLTFIYGDGGNGKSVFLNVISGIMGDYARTADMNTFTASYSDKHTTDLAMLVGARLVTASETTAGKRWDEQRVKSATGGERITARFMRQDNFTFEPQFKLIFVGNYKPEIRDVGDAMRRRIQIVPFTVKPKVVDKELSAKLKAEWPAILSWMIEGCLEWQEKGLAPPARVVSSTDEYFSEEDAFGRWMKECLSVDAESNETSEALFLSWREWANANGEPVGSQKRMSSALAARRIARWTESKTRKRGFSGLKIEPRQEAWT